MQYNFIYCANSWWCVYIVFPWHTRCLRRTATLNYMRVNIIRVETQSVERGPDICKWTETWPSLDLERFTSRKKKNYKKKNPAHTKKKIQQLLQTKSVCSRPHWKGRSWLKWQLRDTGSVIQHMPALNVITFWWRGAGGGWVHIYFASVTWTAQRSKCLCFKWREQVGNDAGHGGGRSGASNSLAASSSSPCPWF